MRNSSRSDSGGALRKSPASSAPQNFLEERHGQSTLRDERRFIERVEHAAQRVHVARKTLQEIVSALARELEAAQGRTPCECLRQFGIIERAHLKYSCRREARTEVIERPADGGGRRRGGEYQNGAVLRRAVVEIEQRPLPARIARGGVDVVDCDDAQRFQAREHSGPEGQ